MAHAKEPTTPTTATPPPPPPSIGKIGPYTVFLTPPSTPTPTPTAAVTHKPSPSPTTVAIPIPETPKKVAPPVQPPPIQYPTSPVDRFAFLRRALSKVHQVHSSVDEYMANWLGLDQSKYQWALNDYYETKGLEKGDALTKEVTNKSQTV
ncbi:uncharacterized protein LOC141605847 [Silene latifolia]|uniref:uncharacterized protein LOC141605847 n=1 Tax=Silene latifolia TaxID=37657 RepID=UPI003D76BA59